MSASGFINKDVLEIVASSLVHAFSLSGRGEPDMKPKLEALNRAFNVLGIDCQIKRAGTSFSMPGNDPRVPGFYRDVKKICLAQRRSQQQKTQTLLKYMVDNYTCNRS